MVVIATTILKINTGRRSRVRFIATLHVQNIPKDLHVVIRLLVEVRYSRDARNLIERIGSPDPGEFYVPGLLFAERIVTISALSIFMSQI